LRERVFRRPAIACWGEFGLRRWLLPAGWWPTPPTAMPPRRRRWRRWRRWPQPRWRWWRREQRLGLNRRLAHEHYTGNRGSDPRKHAASRQRFDHCG